jgi:hypothetical protein
VLAVAAAAVAGIVALGVIASAAVWGFRNGTDESLSGPGGWLLLLWVSVAVAIAMVIGVALAAVRALRRPLDDLSRAAETLQGERLPAALRDIEAGSEPAPRPPITAPAELEGVAGALENLERVVHHHAKRAHQADQDLGELLTGAADRAAARARLAEGIDLAKGLHRDEDALRALVPGAPSARAANAAVGLGPSIAATVAAATQTTLRPDSVAARDLEPVIVDAGVSGTVTVVLGEVLDAAMGDEGDVVVHGAVQPEGYHLFVDAAMGTRHDELAQLADALRERDPSHLPFGLRAGVKAGKRARLLVWLTLADENAQWHVLVPPDAFVPTARPVKAVPIGGRRVVTTPVAPAEPAIEETDPARAARRATALRLSEALTDLLGRLEVALEARDSGRLDEAERTALLVDGTGLVGRLQEADLCSPPTQRALLRAIDAAVATDRTAPLTGSGRVRFPLPYEALAEIRERIAEPPASG